MIPDANVDTSRDRNRIAAMVNSIANLERDCTRALLSQAIIDAILSWPEHERRLFAWVHYDGWSLEKAAGALGLDLAQAPRMFEVCDGSLRASLRDFSSSPFK